MFATFFFPFYTSTSSPDHKKTTSPLAFLLSTLPLLFQPVVLPTNQSFFLSFMSYNLTKHLAHPVLSPLLISSTYSFPDQESHSLNQVPFAFYTAQLSTPLLALPTSLSCTTHLLWHADCPRELSFTEPDGPCSTSMKNLQLIIS